MHDLRVDSGPVELAVRDFGGQGVPLVLVHGGYASLESWSRFASLLTGRFHVVGYDLRGHGHSGDSEDVSLEDHAGDLSAVVAALDLDHPVVVGLSLGAFVAAVWAANGAPCRTLVLIEGPSPEPWPFDRDAFRSLAESRRWEGRDAELEERIATAISAFDSWDANERRKYRHRSDGSWEQRPSLDAEVEMFAQVSRPVGGLLAGLGPPTTLVFGRDRHHEAGAFVLADPLVRTACLDAGHDVSRERPAELAVAVDDAVPAGSDILPAGSKLSLVAKRALLARAVEVSEADDRIGAAWLGGSFGANRGDAFSDLDVHLCVVDDDLAGLEADWRQLLDRITPTVHAELVPAPPGLLVCTAVAADWERLDLAFHARSAVEAAPPTGARPLFDRLGLFPSGPVPVPADGLPTFPAMVVTWFLYILGHLATVCARDELVMGVNGFVTMRDTGLVPLLLAERGVDRQGGNKRLRDFLTQEQYGVLENLPVPQVERDSLIESAGAVARAFLPRARSLALRTGASYPDALEEATLSHLERQLGLTIDLGPTKRG